MSGIKNFGDFINERVKIDSIPRKTVLLSAESKVDGAILMLYNTSSKTPIGYISYSYYDEVGSYTVGGAYSERGYGPFLYESVMTNVYPNALSMSRCGSTSFDALGVWEQFNERSDVRSERMYSDELTHKREDLPAGGTFDDDPEALQEILDLEDTRFYYTYGKDKLNKLLEIGEKYKIKNNISKEDIVHMQYALE
jgi:hypothetical protein